MSSMAVGFNHTVHQKNIEYRFFYIIFNKQSFIYFRN